MTRGLPFQYLLHQSVGEGATPFPGLLYFTLDTYLIFLSVKQGVSSTIFKVFVMTRPRIEPRSPGPLRNTLPNRLMIQFKTYSNKRLLVNSECLNGIEISKDKQLVRIS